MYGANLKEYRARLGSDPAFATQEREKQAATRAMSPLDRAKAMPSSYAKAVRAKCWDCVGRGADPDWKGAVRECQITSCGLWHLRAYR
jgi:hypothetical protein